LRIYKKALKILLSGKKSNLEREMGKFKLGSKSLKELTGVHKDLVRVVKRAIEITVQDFSVHDGIRTLDEQKRLVEKGASQTLKSRHITGHAVDLVPYINGKLRWEWDPIYKIADAVRLAAEELKVPIRWGGAWDILFTGVDDAPEDMVVDYGNRRRAAGKKIFIDGPHFELPKSKYP
jgi:peptidoglycan L-alanyl-D-glutamate endopeptidase CwlK